MKNQDEKIKAPDVQLETKEISNEQTGSENENKDTKLQEISSYSADPKQLKDIVEAKTKKPNQDNPNERQGFENKGEMNKVEQRLMRTKSGKPDKTYRTHIEQNNNQTGIPIIENKV